ncbi:MAG: tRNA 5-methylaminomethyl-2-thiouridine biosynthesis bifunctional protein MnmC [Chlamydiales bacterium]|nr:tRNA 5-methylaminomethyl-2-thiouridine biosynthesis bifunctional protein MnmC [Chlamydiales bacterium]
MRIAILGAGFAGLAVSWFLLHYKQGSVAIDLYDPEPIGGGVSGLSSGLLHTYPGKEARLSWRAQYCMKETHRLLTEASGGIGQSVILSKGILRPAISEQQNVAFKKCGESHDDTEWWDFERCMHEVPGLQIPDSNGGLYIRDGLTVDVQAYLQGLWQTLARFGVQYHQSAMVHQSDLDKYDRILIAIGPQCKSIPALQSLPLNPVKGQILDLEWPKGAMPPRFSLNSHKYLVMSKDLKTCTVGATFEREFATQRADQELAAGALLPNITSFFPALEKAKIIRCRAGFRACTPNHLPIVGQIDPKTYFFTGLGSKGLLYHAWVGKRVARAILTKDPRHFPTDIGHTLD